MNSVYDFIIEPIGERYNNTKKVEDKELILNTSIESFKHVNKQAKVVSCPLAFKTNVKEGDIVMVHHNVFRRFYDIKGREKNSRSHFKDGKYFCGYDQIYLYKRNGEWKSFLDRCFIKPLLDKSPETTSKLKSNIGVVRYGNSSLEDVKIKPGALVGFKNGREFEFIVDNELLYCMKSNDIVIEYEYKGDEEEYNPSWASSS
jgi:hypothetical protein